MPDNPRKKQERIYQNLAKLVAALELDTTETFKDWIHSDLFEIHWQEYETSFLKQIQEQTKGRTKKHGGEFAHVVKQIALGNSGGKATYSHPRPDKSKWTGIDHQARLLYQLVEFNTMNNNGILYGKHLSEQDAQWRIWNCICWKTWQNTPSRISTRQKTLEQQRLQNVATEPSTSTPAETHVATPEGDTPMMINPHRGFAMITWDDIPDDLLDESVASRKPLKGICDLTRAEFVEKVTAIFDLKKYNVCVSSLIYGDDMDTFEEFQEYAGSVEGRVEVKFSTVLATPDSVLPELAEPMMSAEPEMPVVSPYDLMLADQKSSTMNLDERYWQYTLARVVGQAAGQQYHLKDIELKEGNAHADTAGIEAYALLHEINAIKEDDESGTLAAPEFQEISKEEIKTYQEQEKWMDNPDLQPSDLEAACAKLRIPNPAVPRMPGMTMLTLKFWQPTAAAALVEFEKGPLRGGVLADEVGIGKTFTMLSVILHGINERAARIREGLPVGQAKPTLIILPPNLISQWTKSCSDFSGLFIVKIYYSSGKAAMNISGTLSRSHEIFADTEDTARTIILTSYMTLTSRHGPNALKKWRVEQFRLQHPKMTLANIKQTLANKKFKLKDPDRAWCGDLHGCFERIVMDEGHDIRNMETHTWTTIKWIVATSSRHIMTATPLLNGPGDFRGLMAMLEPAEDMWEAPYLATLGIKKPPPKSPKVDKDGEPISEDDDDEDFFDPWEVPDDDHRAILRYTARSITLHVLQSGIDKAVMGVRLRKIFTKCLIRRSYGSMIAGKTIGSNLPPVQTMNVQVEFETQDERRFYNQAYDDSLKRLFKKGKNEETIWDTNVYRAMCLMTSWLSFQYLTDYRVKKLREFRKKNGDAFRILKDLRARQLKHGVLDPVKVPEQDDVQGALELLCKGSPKLRYLLLVIAELVLLKKEKVIIWVYLPAQMEFLEQALKLLKVDIQSYRADLPMKKRADLASDFNNSKDKCMVLLCSYLVSACGLDLHQYCRNIVLFEPPPNDSIWIQVLGRQRRIGADKWIRLIALFLADSFNMRQRSTNVIKALPGLMAQLNLEVWGSNDADDKEVPLGDWVVYEKALYRKHDPTVKGLGCRVLQPDELLVLIKRAMQGLPVEIDDITSSLYNNQMKRPLGADPEDDAMD